MKNLRILLREYKATTEELIRINLVDITRQTKSDKIKSNELNKKLDEIGKQLDQYCEE